jgi:hypothetical protein
VARRLDEVVRTVQDGPTAFEVASRRHGQRLHGPDGPLHMAETLALLTHLERRRRVRRDRIDAVERWNIRSHN